MNTTLQELGITSGDVILEISYLLAAILFIVGLKFMSHPETAKKGNLWAAVGMGLAMVTTLFLHRNDHGEGISLNNGILVVASIIVGSMILVHTPTYLQVLPAGRRLRGCLI